MREDAYTHCYPLLITATHYYSLPPTATHCYSLLLTATYWHLLLPTPLLTPLLALLLSLLLTLLPTLLPTPLPTPLLTLLLNSTTQLHYSPISQVGVRPSRWKPAAADVCYSKARDLHCKDRRTAGEHTPCHMQYRLYPMPCRPVSSRPKLLLSHAVQVPAVLRSVVTRHAKRCAYYSAAQCSAMQLSAELCTPLLALLIVAYVANYEVPPLPTQPYHTW